MSASSEDIGRSMRLLRAKASELEERAIIHLGKSGTDEHPDLALTDDIGALEADLALVAYALLDFMSSQLGPMSGFLGRQEVAADEDG